ncbi:MAG: hypothetical protein IT558_01755 [Alphaproteobacteria bacterium]|nr:hypothetical protein [Alphaproteobacteria bacterium]
MDETSTRSTIARLFGQVTNENGMDSAGLIKLMGDEGFTIADFWYQAAQVLPQLEYNRKFTSWFDNLHQKPSLSLEVSK